MLSSFPRSERLRRELRVLSASALMTLRYSKSKPLEKSSEAGGSSSKKRCFAVTLTRSTRDSLPSICTTMELKAIHLRSRSSLKPGLCSEQPLLRSTLQASRDRIKKGEFYIVLNAEGGKWQGSQAITVIRVTRHVKTKSEVWDLGSNLRERSVGRDQRLNKAYLIPAKPLLLPFAERPINPTISLRLLQRSRRLLPKGFLSLFQSAHPSPVASQPLTERKEVPRSSSVVQADL